MGDTRKDMTSRRVGRWLVLRFSHTAANGGAYWLCRCECGTERAVFGGNLRNQGTLSCGCLTRETNTGPYGEWLRPEHTRAQIAATFHPTGTKGRQPWKSGRALFALTVITRVPLSIISATISRAHGGLFQARSIHHTETSYETPGTPGWGAMLGDPSLCR
jgi:hypothetical protein